MSTREEPVFAALESTYNDGTAPVGGDAILAADLISFDPTANAQTSERNVVRAGTISKKAPTYGGSAPTMTIPVELKGSGALGVAPEWGRLLRACGFVETINAGVSVVYTPRPQGTTFESLSLYYWWQGLRYHLTGAIGNCTLSAEAGQNPILEIALTGRMAPDSHVDAAQLTPTYDSSVPVSFRGNNFLTVGGFNPTFLNFGFDLRNQIAVGRNANTADGFGQHRITSRQIGVTLDPEATSKATFDWLGDLEQGTSRALSLVHGTVGGNRVTISMPAVKPEAFSPAERDELRTIDYGYVAEDTAALNDDMTITID